MSVPFGGSQPAAPQPHSPGEPSTGPNLAHILSLVAAGLALVIYALSFSDDAFGFNITGGLILPLLLAGGLLAGANAVLKSKTLLTATLLTTLGFLILLAFAIKSGGDASAVVWVILIAALLQFAATLFALLVDHGIVKLAPRVRSYGPPAGNWAPQSGPFPQQGYGAGPGYGQQPGGQYGQYGGAPGGQPQYGQPPQGAQPPLGGQQPPLGAQPTHGAQPGQPGGQPGQPGQSGQPGQVQPGQGQGGGAAGGPSSETRQFGQQPYGGQPPYGGGGQGQQGGSPGGF